MDDVYYKFSEAMKDLDKVIQFLESHKDEDAMSHIKEAKRLLLDVMNKHK